MRFSTHFDSEEFKSKDGTDFTDEVVKNLLKVAKQLEVIRKHLGCPIYITSAYRSPEYNELIGGAKNSFHVKGMAVDFKTKKHEPKDIAKILELLMMDGKISTGGIGIYKSWVHYDIRGYKANWNG
jgi:uncharacterized protein YcbK (DUF882 family)